MRNLKIGKSFTVAFSPAADLLASVGRFVSLWNLPRRKKTARAHPFSHPSHMCFSPDGSRLAVKNTAGLIVVLDSLTGSTAVAFGNRNDGEGSNLHYSVCGNYIVDGAWNGRVIVRTAETGEPRFVREFPNTLVGAVHRAADGGRWVVQHSCKATTGGRPEPDYFSLWDWPLWDGTYRVLPLRIPFARTSALSPDGQYLAVVHGAPPQTLTVFRVDDGTVAASVPVEIGGPGSALCWSPDARQLGSVQRGKVVFYRWPSLETEQSVDLEYPSDVAFSPCAIAIGSWESGVVLTRPAQQ